MDRQRALAKVCQLVARAVPGGRPAAVWSLVLLGLAGSLGCFAAVIWPLNIRAPRALELIFASALVLLSLIFWLFGKRVKLVALEAFVVFALAGVSAIIAKSATYQGVVLTSFAYVWTVIYAAYNFPRRASHVILVFISAGFGAALLENPKPKAYLVWFLMSGTCAVTGLLLEHLASDLRSQAKTDALTGLLNRRGFVAEATKARAAALKSGQPMTIVVIDLDGFKAVNDLEGHEGGDRVLAAIAMTWRSQLRPKDILSRFGGDEFVCSYRTPLRHRARSSLKICGSIIASAGRLASHNGSTLKSSRTVCVGQTGVSMQKRVPVLF